MKAILEFELPEESGDLKTALEGYKWSLAFSDVYDWLKRISRGKEEPLKASNIYEAIDIVLKKMDDIQYSYNIIKEV
jgi:hypothetical protein